VSLKELNDHEQMDFFKFIGNLKRNKMEMKVREGREPSKKESIIFKDTLTTMEEDESMNEEDEEYFSMLIRKVGKVFYKKGRMSNF